MLSSSEKRRNNNTVGEIVGEHVDIILFVHPSSVLSFYILLCGAGVTVVPSDDLQRRG